MDSKVSPDSDAMQIAPEKEMNVLMQKIEEQKGTRSELLMAAASQDDSKAIMSKKDQQKVKESEDFLEQLREPDQGPDRERLTILRTEFLSQPRLPPESSAFDRRNTDGKFEAPYIAPLPSFLNRAVRAESVRLAKRDASPSMLLTGTAYESDRRETLLEEANLSAQNLLIPGRDLHHRRHTLVNIEMLQNTNDFRQHIHGITSLEACNLHLEPGKLTILFQHLQSLPGIYSLNLSHNEMGPQGCGYLIETLKANHSITEVDITNNHISYGFNSICHHLKDSSCNLRILNISHNKIGNEGAEKLSDALKKNHSITSLDVSYNELKPKGIAPLLHAVKENGRIRHFSIRGNQLGRIGPESVFALVELLSDRKCVIRTLDISLNSLGTFGAKQVSGSLKTNTTVTSLDISENELGWEGASAIGDCLKTNRTITKLDISVNLIQAKGGGCIASAIAQNSVLREVNIAGNFIREGGASLIAFALRAPKCSVNDLNINWNEIGPDGCTSIAQALKKNKSLTKLGCANNEMGVKGAIAMADGIRQNKHLYSLDLRTQVIKESGAQAIARAIDTNRTLLECKFDKFRSFLGDVNIGTHLNKRYITLEGCIASAQERNREILRKLLYSLFPKHRLVHIKKQTLDVVIAYAYTGVVKGIN